MFIISYFLKTTTNNLFKLTTNNQMKVNFQEILHHGSLELTRHRNNSLTYLWCPDCSALQVRKRSWAPPLRLCDGLLLLRASEPAEGDLCHLSRWICYLREERVDRSVMHVSPSTILGTPLLLPPAVPPLLLLRLNGRFNLKNIVFTKFQELSGRFQKQGMNIKLLWIPKRIVFEGF